MSETSRWGPVRLVCGNCGARDLPDGSTRTGLPQGWEYFMVRGERRNACPECIEAGGAPYVSAADAAHHEHDAQASVDAYLAAKRGETGAQPRGERT